MSMEKYRLPTWTCLEIEMLGWMLKARFGPWFLHHLIDSKLNHNELYEKSMAHQLRGKICHPETVEYRIVVFYSLAK